MHRRQRRRHGCSGSRTWFLEPGEWAAWCESARRPLGLNPSVSRVRWQVAACPRRPTSGPTQQLPEQAQGHVSPATPVQTMDRVFSCCCSRIRQPAPGSSPTPTRIGRAGDLGSGQAPDPPPASVCSRAVLQHVCCRTRPCIRITSCGRRFRINPRRLNAKPPRRIRKPGPPSTLRSQCFTVSSVTESGLCPLRRSLHSMSITASMAQSCRVSSHVCNRWRRIPKCHRGVMACMSSDSQGSPATVA
jgi:hypothetical protein